MFLLLEINFENTLLAFCYDPFHNDVNFIIGQLFRKSTRASEIIVIGQKIVSHMIAYNIFMFIFYAFQTLSPQYSVLTYHSYKQYISDCQF